MKVPDFSLESKEPFAAAAVAYKAAGLAPIPCNDKAANCVRWKTKPPQPGPNLVAKFSDKNIGMLTGKRSRVFIVDIDDPAQVDAMKARFGNTPIATASPSGGQHLWYLWNGEPCGKLPGVDLKGEGGFVVGPPSFRREGKHQGKPYYFIRGGLEDVDQLRTILPGSFPQQGRSKSARVAASKPPILAGEKTPGEKRNDRLFMAVKNMAYTLGDNQLAAFAHGYNATEFTDPMDAAEVDKVVISVLGYKAAGKLMRKGAGPFITLTKAELDARIDQPRVLALYLKLRMEHEARPGPFTVDRRAMSTVLGWSPGTVEAARKRLEDQGDLKPAGKGKATQLPSGKWKKQPNLYALNRGPIFVPYTTKHPRSPFFPCAVVSVNGRTRVLTEPARASVALRQAQRAAAGVVPAAQSGKILPFAQGDFFGADMKVSGGVLDKWEHGVMPLEVKRAVKTKMRAACLTQETLATLVGLSRPQLTNALQGRFGLSPAPAAKLKAFLAAA